MLAGIAAGVTLGLLFAPGKGSENREKLSTTVKNLGNTATDKFDSLMGFTGGLVSILKGDTEAFDARYDEMEHAFI